MFRKTLTLDIEQDENEGMIVYPVEEFKQEITPTPSLVDCKKVTTPTTIKHGTQGTVVIGCPDEDKIYKKTAFKPYIRQLRMEPSVAEWVWDNQGRVHDKVNEIYTFQVENFEPPYFIYTYLHKEQKSDDPLDRTFEIVQERVKNSNDLSDREFVTSLTNAQVTSILVQVLEAINILYREGLYHNDTHVGNVLAIENGDGINIRLIDYGLMTIGKPLDGSYNIDKKSNGFPWLDFAQFLQTLSQHFSRFKQPPSLVYANHVLLSASHLATDRKSVPLVKNHKTIKYQDVLNHLLKNLRLEREQSSSSEDSSQDEDFEDSPVSAAFKT